jgi:demethylmenaquinone methyltransferase/2-methoxy-6-polyprenyl-1,4-benzoquinol methylase
MTLALPDPRAPDKGRDVRRMFASIAPRYDLLNRLLSAGQDQRWRRRVVASLPALRAGDRVLDLCTGTGDLALAIGRAAPAGVRLHASDFCEPMLAQLPGKLRAGTSEPRLAVADALALPYAADSFRAVTVAFGLRNVQDPPAAVGEMARVLQQGGRVLILEFGKPEGRLFAAVYRTYFFRVLPKVGRLLSGSEVDAYRYLPESVWSFPDAAQLGAVLRGHGLRVLFQQRLLGGAVVLHAAEKPAR